MEFRSVRNVDPGLRGKYSEYDVLLLIGYSIELEDSLLIVFGTRVCTFLRYSE
jgi:hypothetical protein